MGSINPDASNELEVSFRPLPPDSCVSDAAMEVIKNSLTVTLPQSALDSQNAPCTSKDANNIASVDADGCILVPAAQLYRAEDTWDASSPSTNVVFDAFASLGFDALTCGLAVHIYLDSAETGIVVLKSPSGTANIRPNYEIVERSAAKIEIAIKNALSDVRVEIELTQLPIPPETA